MAQPSIRWEPTLENAQRLAGQTNRLVLIQFWAPWCAVCRQMETEVLSQPSVAAALGANYVSVKINADHFPAMARHYGITALPTTVIVSPQGKLLNTMRGRVDATQYVAWLSRVAIDAKRREAAAYAQVPAVPTVPASMAANRPANAAVASDDRYTNFFRRGQAAAQPPVGRPSRGSPGPMVTQPPKHARPSATAAAPAGRPSHDSPGPMATQPPKHARPSATTAVSATSPQASPPPGILLARGSPAHGQSGQSSSPQASPPSVVGQSPPPTSGPAGLPNSVAVNPPLCLDGYCPVSLCEKQQWVIGDRRWGAIHRGRTYLFASPEEQRRFFTNPDRYAPVTSGNDIILAAEQGQAVPGMREHGVFFENRVYLFSGEASLEKFARNPDVYASQLR